MSLRRTLQVASRRIRIQCMSPLSTSSIQVPCEPPLTSRLPESALKRGIRMIQTESPGFDPHHYTNGRWLHRDTSERQARFIQFDFEALCQRVIQSCPGATSITSCEKKEGGFNRVFVFHTDNAKSVVAKLPFSVAGPKTLTTKSEVATIKYLQKKTRVPIPTILEWSDDAHNSIGSEYIIMEHATGVSLHERWPTMDLNERIGCIKSIYMNMKEVAELKFSAYGSIYPKKAAGAISKLSLDEDHCIGPHCGPRYWDCGVGSERCYRDVSPNQGPWLNLGAFCDGLVDTGRSRIPSAQPSNQPCYKGNIKMHHELLENARVVISNMAEDPRIQAASQPVLYHPDLHKRNIFVSKEDPEIVTAIIDWQSCSIEPAFWYADEVPDFAQPVPDPECADKMEPKSEVCAKAYSASMHFLIPSIAKVMSMDESLFRPMRFAYSTWNFGAVALCEELIQTALHWDELGLAGSCPFLVPNETEIAEHRADYEKFQFVQRLKHSISQALECGTDGWVHADDWETTKSTYREAYKAMVQAILEEEDVDDDEPVKSEADIRELWPFDLDLLDT
ncbi:hypothetical protein HBH56_166810 [Parastagonospora nodorum]|uniref:Altered inheritance of mitochondria protein 9, mitochondrial n=1 Tax=Phaeosphaeria nodorum (strain SN15 / ATCC MYA-4574 / FGSC 10173) TaxID=321614 RepID=A0A7U2F4I1_PHANO|nr:hypothetical protein HBH56_166810 [Parastagonospora nodorum]QRC98573.1 hypothetical protein JI435_046240 [Parastagonospora nodorum SN15]KAH3936092.1 hypothetical protein HBH54_029890 [Parastagonospora nodorum]KAH4144805.1 hypothetical protein HBH45_020380 [Parastagonospora nodorum]KAH4175351.1 hypothetical protein HBH44_009390 [Parastagonospora nodorum]